MLASMDHWSGGVTKWGTRRPISVVELVLELSFPPKVHVGLSSSPFLAQSLVAGLPQWVPGNAARAERR